MLYLLVKAFNSIGSKHDQHDFDGFLRRLRAFLYLACQCGRQGAHPHCSAYIHTTVRIDSASLVLFSLWEGDIRHDIIPLQFNKPLQIYLCLFFSD